MNKSDSWESHIAKQKFICDKYDSNWNPIDKNLMVGWSVNLEKNPINGLRHPKEYNETGWYIWSGEYSNDKDFFKPICAKHLFQIRPEIIKYLGLDVGFRFLADKNGYEDIWFDKDLLILE